MTRSTLLPKSRNCSPGDEGMDIWLEALDTFFCGDAELIEYVQKVIGLAAIGKVYEEFIIIAYGDGANGKSTFWNTVARVLGTYAGKISSDILTMGNKVNAQPEMAELKGKRLIIASEMQEGVRLNTAMVKQLCSTDEIQACKKYKDPFHFIPSHQEVLYTNHLPKVGANDDGIWRRLKVIPFNAKIKGNSDIKNYAILAPDWTDLEVWKKANPSLGETIGIDKVEAACESARQNPGEENAFRQLRLNQWVKQSIRWMPMEKWDACAFPVNEDDLEGRVCYGGLDLSSTTDLTSFCLVFPPEDEEGKYYVLPYFWLPEETLDLRVRRDHVNYDVWEKQGYIQTTEGNVVHYGFIEKFIEHLGERFNIREIAFDRWGAVQMVQNLEGMGFNVVAMGQGFASMSPPTKELMKV